MEEEGGRQSEWRSRVGREAERMEEQGGGREAERMEEQGGEGGRANGGAGWGEREYGRERRSEGRGK
jgi:hypothetical protein